LRVVVALLFIGVLLAFTGNAAFTIVHSTPVISLTPVSGRIGSRISVTGTGFLPTDATCTLSSPSSGSVIISGACVIRIGTGLLTGGFIVGYVTPGVQYVIQATGNQGDSAQVLLTVDGGPQIGLSPATGPTGTQVSVRGTGFLPIDNTCTVSSPSSGVILLGTSACSIQIGTGLPIAGFTIGNVPPGQYLIQVTGNHGDYAQAILSVM
jgi:hypothetical protein